MNTQNTIISSSSSPSAPVQIIDREHHNISRKNISANALRVLYKLREAGFSAYLVGGAVRDLLLGAQPKDFDVATNATPEQVRQLFRNCRLIGRRFRLAHVMYGDEIIEVATFRANTDDGSGDREVNNGRLVRDNVYGTIEDDALRRDFTINAMYYTVEDFTVRDYAEGFNDLKLKQLKLIGVPEQRYREDPVRMLRAIRFAAKLGFSIEKSTAEPISRLAYLLKDASPARLFEEVLKLFLGGYAVASFELLERYELLPILFPSTCKALATNRSGVLRTMLLQGLANTDKRVASQEPVSPVFLFALLLWPAYCRCLTQLQGQGIREEDSRQRAADKVTVQQLETLSIPRRFSTPMHEIWLMQPRFSQRQRKRVFRLLAHPRFRASFDFLVLRLVASPEHAEDVMFWQQAQELTGEQLTLLINNANPDDANKPKRKKRSSSRKKAASGVSGASETPMPSDASPS